MTWRLAWPEPRLAFLPWTQYWACTARSRLSRHGEADGMVFEYGWGARPVCVRAVTGMRQNE